MLDTLVRPAHLWVPDRRGSYGDEAADLTAMAGRELDPEQRLAVDAMLSYGPGGRWLALESGVVEARQNGKTGGVLLPVTLFDLFLMPPDRIVWTAHLFRTARDAFMDFVGLIEGCAELSRRVKRVVYANGEEAIELHSGAKLEFLARSKGGGRGLGGKRVVMDEALFLAADSMGALMPTLSARPDPQINYGSSAGLGHSDHLRTLRDRGRRGGDPSLIWVEWCAPGGWDDPPCAAGRECTHVLGSDGCALDDESLWQLANHSLGRRISVEYVRAERRALPPSEFGRERLGWFDLPETEEKPIDPAAFAAVMVEHLERPESVPTFFLDASPGMRSAAIGIAGSDDAGLILDEERDVGTDWLVPRAAELKERYPDAQWFYEQAGAVGALLPALAEAGIEPEPFSAADMGRACGHLQTLVADKQVRIVADETLTVALAGAVKRDVGEGLWAWGRRKSTTDISPLVAITGAAWAHVRREQPQPFFAAWR